jgi:hypothetical protein
MRCEASTNRPSTLPAKAALAKASADRGGDRMNADRLIENPLVAIGKRDYRHCCNSLNPRTVSPSEIIKGTP